MNFRWDNTYQDANCVYKTKIFPSGMTARIDFWLYNLANISVASVELNVFHKRKQVNDNWLHMTGKDGIAPFVWAWNMIAEFDTYAKKEINTACPLYFQVSGSDKKRWKMYKKVLQKRGFEIKDFGDGWQLYRFIKNAD